MVQRLKLTVFCNIYILQTLIKGRSKAGKTSVQESMLAYLSLSAVLNCVINCGCCVTRGIPGTFIECLYVFAGVILCIDARVCEFV